MDLLHELNALVLGLFIIASIGMVVLRQVEICLQAFVAQSVLLALSALLLGASPFSWHLMALAAVTLVSKAWIIPWLLRALAPEGVHETREASLLVGTPGALLVALALTFVGYAVGQRLGVVAPTLSIGNVSMGFAALLVGLLLLAVRAQAVPQLLGILAMENGAFMCGIAIAPDFPLIAELAIAFDVPLLTFIVALLARDAYRRLGSTGIGALATLREEPEARS